MPSNLHTNILVQMLFLRRMIMDLVALLYLAATNQSSSCGVLICPIIFQKKKLCFYKYKSIKLVFLNFNLITAKTLAELAFSLRLIKILPPVIIWFNCFGIDFHAELLSLNSSNVVYLKVYAHFVSRLVDLLAVQCCTKKN